MANTEPHGEKLTQGPSPKVQSKLVALFNRASLPLFVIALVLAAFAGGVHVGKEKVFPYDLLISAYKTSKTLFAVHVEDEVFPVFHGMEFEDISPDSVEARRFEFLGADTLADPILVSGGLEFFTEYCPNARGCLAVEYGGRGEVRHAYPYRPGEFENVPFSVDFPYEQVPGFQFPFFSKPRGISRYSNGDLLVVFWFRHSFPFGGGVARVNRDGHVIWYRRDYSRHVPYITDGAIALVPSLRIGEGPIEFKTKNGQTHHLTSTKKQKYYNDFVHIIDGKGRLLKAISVLDALLESPYAPFLYDALSNPTHLNPTHLNFVHQLREDAGGAKGIAPGDLVVSLRNLSAFGILDGQSHRLKKLVRGGFVRQHSVTHLEEAKFLMFDNWGGDGVHGPSRLLMVDLADGDETTIFPNDRTPEHLRDMFSDIEGHISISQDRRRVIVAYSLANTAVEVRLADGAVLSAFTNLHDMSHLNTLPDERKTKAVRHRIHSIKYIDSNGVSR